MPHFVHYSWPKAAALQSTTDPNQTVKLHCLCTVCQHLVDETHGMIYDPHLDSPYDKLSTEYKHYRTTLELAASSETGCHLCSILWTRFQGEASTLESLRLLESHLQAAFINARDMVPHSYALQLFRGWWGVPYVAEIIFYYPPKNHQLSASEKCYCLLKSCPMKRSPTHIGEIDMDIISGVCIL